MDISIHRFGSRCFLQIGEQSIEIQDYKISSSACEGTELEIKIVYQGDALKFETTATKESLQQQNLPAKNGDSCFRPDYITERGT